MKEPELTHLAKSLDQLDARRKHPAYPNYAESGSKWLCDLPAHWKARRLKFVAVSRPSSVDKKTVDGELAVRLCNYVDVYKNDFITPDLDFMEATAGPNEVAKFRLRRGDVLITKDSEEWADIAVPAFVTQDFDDVVCGYHLSQVRPRPGTMDGEYLFRAFKAGGVSEQFHVAANGVTRFGIPAGAIGDVTFPVPPLAEQQGIALFLREEVGRIDRLIGHKTTLLGFLKEKRAAVVTAAVTCGLDPAVPTKASGVDWLLPVPAHWTVRPFRYSARIVNGQVDPEDLRYRDLQLVAPNHIESGTGRLTGTESAAEQAAESGKYPFELGMVLYSKIRPALAKVCIAPTAGLCSADMYPITPRKDLLAQFLMYFMLSRPFTEAVVLLSSRVAMPKINRRDLGGFAVVVPPLPEQQAIVEHIQSIHSKIDAAAAVTRAAIERLREYRATLVTAAVRGQIDVRQHKPELLRED